MSSEFRVPGSRFRSKGAKLESATALIVGFGGFWLALFTLLAWWAVGEDLTGWVVAGLVLSACAMGAGLALRWRGFVAVLRGRQTAHGAVVMVSIGLLLVVVGVANYVAARHWARWDITADRRYKLDPRTVKLLGSLAAPVDIYAYFAPTNERERRLEVRSRDLLAEYQARQPLLRVEHIPTILTPEAQQRIFRKLGIQSISRNCLLVRYGERTKQIGQRELLTLKRNPFETAAHQIQEIYTVEDALSSAIREVIQNRQKKVYFLAGHGERKTSFGPGGWGHVVDDFKRLNYVVADPLNLRAAKRVPKDCDLLMIAGPQTPLRTEEIDRISAYLDGGGNVLVAVRSIRSGRATRTGLEDLLAQYGIRLRSDFLAGPGVVTQAGRLIPCQEFGMHPIVTPLRHANLFAWIPPCAVLERSADKRRDYLFTALVRSPAKSWGERDPEDRAGLAAGETPRFDKGRDLKGPLILAAASVRKAPESAAETYLAGASGAQAGGGQATEAAVGPRLVVFASTEMFDWEPSRLYQNRANRDLLLNSVSWMLGVSENIGIGSREDRTGRISVDPKTGRMIGIGAIVAAPLLVAVIGLVVWYLRKQ